MHNVELFALDDCPDSIALKRWLRGRGIPYRLHDLSEPEVWTDVKVRTGLRAAPITIVGGQAVWGKATAQIPRIQSLLRSA